MNSFRVHPFFRRALFALFALAGGGAACADENPAPPNPDLLPVYQAFGEKAGLTALMEDFMVNLIADPRTRPFFADADQKHVKEMLTEQFCVILGGPCTYSGKGMKESHAKSHRTV